MATLHITTPLLRREPACGAALAVVHEQLPEVKEFHAPLVVGCGGIGVDLAKLEAWKNHFER